MMSSCLIPSGMRPCTHHRLFQSYLRLWLFAATAKDFQAFQAGLVGSKLKAKAPNCSALHTLHNILYDLRTKLCNHGKNSNQAAGTVPWHVCGEHFTSSHELTAAHSCIDIILYVIYIYIYSYSISNPLYTHTSTYTSRFSWSSAAGAKGKGQGHRTLAGFALKSWPQCMGLSLLSCKATTLFL